MKNPQRSARFLALGATVLGVGAPAVLTGCADEPVAAQAAATKGVTVVVREQPDGSWKIEDEQVVDGPSRTVVIHADGKTETITDPEAFAAKLPATPPPSGYHANHSSFGLADVLMMSMLMDAWSPSRYSGYRYEAPRTVYVRESTYRNRDARRSAFSSFQRRGLAATPAQARSSARGATNGTARQQAAPKTRSSAPRAGRSGFGRSSSRGGG